MQVLRILWQSGELRQRAPPDISDSEVGLHTARKATGEDKTMTEDNLDQDGIRAQLAELRQEHRDLDHSIAALIETGRGDVLQLQRLKKKKLVLRDKIQVLETQLLPDIIA